MGWHGTARPTPHLRMSYRRKSMIDGAGLKQQSIDGAKQFYSISPFLIA